MGRGEEQQERMREMKRRRREREREMGKEGGSGREGLETYLVIDYRLGSCHTQRGRGSCPPAVERARLCNL